MHGVTMKFKRNPVDARCNHEVYEYIVFLRRFTATLAISGESRVQKIDQLFPRPVKPLFHPPTHLLTPLR